MTVQKKIVLTIYESILTHKPMHQQLKSKICKNKSKNVLTF